MARNRIDKYSDKIRLCTGSENGGPGEEPYPYAWGDDCSMSEGHGTVHKLYFFTLINGHHFGTNSVRPADYVSPNEICPIDVFHAFGFPARGERLRDIRGEENEWYNRFMYRGNGTLQHQRGSEIWVYDAEFSSSGADYEDNDVTVVNELTLPWDKKPWSVSLDFPETVKPFRYAYKNNKKFIVDNDGIRRPLRPVVNSAGDRIMAETTQYDIQLSFTYALKPRSDIDITTIRSAQGSVNDSTITLCGLKIPAGMGRIIAIKPQLIEGTADDSGNEVKSHWEVSATVQILTDTNDSFNTKLYNTGNRALFNRYATVSANGVVSGNSYAEGQMYKSPVYQWWSFSSSKGQCDPNSTVQFGSRKLLLFARYQYEKLELNTKFGSFAYEECQDIPLTMQGIVDKSAMNEQSENFGKYVTLEFPEFRTMNWNTNSVFKQVSGKGGYIKW